MYRRVLQFLLLCALSFPSPALAKEVLILLPLNVDKTLEKEAQLFGTALQQGLGNSFDVFFLCDGSKHHEFCCVFHVTVAKTICFDVCSMRRQQQPIVLLCFSCDGNIGAARHKVTKATSRHSYVQHK